MTDDNLSNRRDRDDRGGIDDEPREFPVSRRGTLAAALGLGGLGLLGGEAAAKPKGGKGNPPFVDVSDDGTKVLEDVADINFATDLSVTDDGDGTVSVDSEAAGGKWNDDDGDDLLEPNAGFLGIDLSGISGSKIVASLIETDGDDFNLEAGDTTTGDARNVVAGHASNEVGDGAVGATIGGGGRDDGTDVEPNEVLDDYGTVAGGRNNVAGTDDGDPATSRAATVGGGFGNTASGFGAVVSGGGQNEASGDGAFIGSGANKVASGLGAVAVGGGPNEATGDGTFVGTGEFNTADGPGAFIGNGNNHSASGVHSVVGSGSENAAETVHSFVGTGAHNTASGQGAFVGTGNNNVASGQGSVVVDGGSCTASGDGAFVGAGTENEATGNGSFVGSGGSNTASGNGSFVGSGSDQTASGPSAFIGTGRRHTASALGTFIGNGDENTASAPGAFVGAGEFHTASGPAAFVGTGSQNTASGQGSFVGSGFNHTASGTRSVVPGGTRNVATGNDSFAAGITAEAADDNSFVWNDGTGFHGIDGGSAQGLSSAKDVAGSGVTGPNTFHVGAQGGVRFVTGSNSVTYISGGSTGWATTSTRAAKTDVEPVDPEEVLAGVEEMEVSTWEYRDEDGHGQGVRHIGPMAEDFHEVVDVGESDDHINTINADGVALAAIRGLAERLAERDERIEDLEAENEELRERLDAIEERLPS